MKTDLSFKLPLVALPDWEAEDDPLATKMTLVACGECGVSEENLFNTIKMWTETLADYNILASILNGDVVIVGYSEDGEMSVASAKNYKRIKHDKCQPTNTPA